VADIWNKYAMARMALVFIISANYANFGRVYTAQDYFLRRLKNNFYTSIMEVVYIIPVLYFRNTKTYLTTKKLGEPDVKFELYHLRKYLIWYIMTVCL